MNPIQSELVVLVDMFCEGDIEPQQAARLEALVAESEESRQYLLDCFQVHCELAWELRRDSAGLGALCAPDRSDIVADKLPAPPSKPASKQRHGWRSAAVAVALLVAVALGLSIYIRGVVQQSAHPSSVARIGQLKDCDATAPAADSLLAAGRKLVFERGLMEVVFDGGAKTIVQGPAEVELQSPSAVLLLRGSLTADVPAVAHGFTVHTPNATVVDLGTRFGVACQADQTDVEVFAGKVVLRLDGSQSGTGPQELTMAASEAARVSGAPGHGAMKIEQVAAGSRSFVQSMAASDASLERDAGRAKATGQLPSEIETPSDIERLHGRFLANVSGPPWAAQGSSSVYSARQVEGRLEIIDRKTGAVVRQWPAVKVADDAPVWSPDGRYLAFAGFRCASGVILGVLDVEKNLLFRVGDNRFDCPRWSTDGSQLAVVVWRQGEAENWSLETSLLRQSEPLAPAAECPGVPEAAAELIGPWHSPTGKLVPIDLNRFFTAEKRGTTDDSQLDLAAGKQVLAGVEFQIGSRMIQLKGPQFAQMPPSVNAIPVRHPVARLYILHATQRGMKSQGLRDGDLIAEYRVRYAGGDQATIPVVIGQDVRDWWLDDQTQVSRGQVAWAGTNAAIRKNHGYVRLFLSTWENPHPEKSIESIDYVSLNSKTAPFCLAITAEEPPAAK